MADQNASEQTITRYHPFLRRFKEGPDEARMLERPEGDYVLYADHEAALAAAARDAEERTVERLSAMLPSDLKVIADIGFPQTTIRVERELAAKDARIAELEKWHSALMPHLERLLDRNPDEFGIDGDGEDCWPLLAEFVTRGRALLEEAK